MMKDFFPGHQRPLLIRFSSQVFLRKSKSRQQSVSLRASPVPCSPTGRILAFSGFNTARRQLPPISSANNPEKIISKENKILRK